jgi:hypothetical protein
VWVDKKLRVTSRRTFSDQMMQKWDKLVSVVKHVVLNEDVDASNLVLFEIRGLLISFLL